MLLHIVSYLLIDKNGRAINYVHERNLHLCHPGRKFILIHDRIEQFIVSVEIRT